MISKALVAASTKPLILSILKAEESYGYQIIQRVKDLSAGDLKWSDGMLYPVLHRLEKNNLIRSSWIISDKGRHRKYYSITPRGAEALAKDMAEWLNVHGVLARLWDSFAKDKLSPAEV